MKSDKRLAKEINVAFGKEKAELVLKNGKIVNVFTEEIEEADVAIEKGIIVGIGRYRGYDEVDVKGKYICPGFLDGHIHIESSMVTPHEFEQAVIVHGTTGVITDPHEITNVAGEAGIRYMMMESKNLALDVYFMLPSCVPATSLDESGAVLTAEELEKFYDKERILGLAELMDFYKTAAADKEIIRKISGALRHGAVIDGHAPGFLGNALNAYITAGVRSDHECSESAEALEKMKRGQWIMIREGTAAKNLKALMPMFEAPYYERCMLVTDDKHPGDLLRLGHIDYIIREAVKLGADPIRAIKMGSFNTACYFGLKNKGAIAPGYAADIAIIDNMTDMSVAAVYKNGEEVARDGKSFVNKKEVSKWDKEIKERVFKSFNLKTIDEKQLQLKNHGNKIRVIQLKPHELSTTQREADWKEIPGFAKGVDVENDVIKIAAFERHHNTGHVGIGFLGGYGLKNGAVATSIGHDSHNLLIAGTNDRDMVLAGNCVRASKGGLAIALGGKIIGELPLPVGGIMSDRTVEDVDKDLERLKSLTADLGISADIDAFMTLAFVSLPVIPELRLNTKGVIDVDKQKIIDATY